METLANLESFVRSAETGSFTAAARQLALTPAAVSRNVAVLEKNLGLRLFQRSTRKLTLTDAGVRFRQSIGDSLEALQAAIAAASDESGEPAGVLKVSMAPGFGVEHILPMLPAFRALYPHVIPEWHFENRPVDLITENYDAAIGGGFELSPGIVSRPLAPAHIVAVVAPEYIKGRALPSDPAELRAFDGIVLRSPRTGRTRHWTMRDVANTERLATLNETIIVNDPAAMREAAALGLGVAMIAMPDALSLLERGALVRLLPQWYADAGAISIYYATRTLMAAKTRAFIDFVVENFQRERLAERFAGSLA